MKDITTKFFIEYDTENKCDVIGEVEIVDWVSVVTRSVLGQPITRAFPVYGRIIRSKVMPEDLADMFDDAVRCEVDKFPYNAENRVIKQWLEKNEGNDNAVY